VRQGCKFAFLPSHAASCVTLIKRTEGPINAALPIQITTSSCRKAEQADRAKACYLSSAAQNGENQQCGQTRSPLKYRCQVGRVYKGGWTVN